MSEGLGRGGRQLGGCDLPLTWHAKLENSPGVPGQGRVCWALAGTQAWPERLDSVSCFRMEGARSANAEGWGTHGCKLGWGRESPTATEKWAWGRGFEFGRWSSATWPWEGGGPRALSSGVAGRGEVLEWSLCSHVGTEPEPKVSWRRGMQEDHKRGQEPRGRSASSWATVSSKT